MKQLVMALCLAGLADAVLAAAPAQEPTAWKAGVAAKITPETPIWMAGYAARKKSSESAVATDRFAKALERRVHLPPLRPRAPGGRR